MRRIPDHARHRRKSALAALLASLAILLQGLIPAAAIAHDHAGDVQVCTPQGMKTIHPAGGPAQGHFGGLACEQCVMASFAALASTAPPLPAPAAWTYAALALPAPAAAPEQPRPPPRPPSRAPPILA